MIIDSIDTIPTLWPPRYAIRHSKRAKRTLLQITPKKGLEIIIPYRKKLVDIEALLHEKRNWIEKASEKMLQHPLNMAQEISLPSTILCKAIDKEWQVVYEKTPHTKLKLVIDREILTLFIYGDIHNSKACAQKLIIWLKKEAKKYLLPCLPEISLQKKLGYKEAIIRGQSTLWGSCNSTKKISLNYKLLLLPRALAQHVMLHELCHTRYLNHSVSFWRLLKSFDAEFETNKKALKTAEHHLPLWLNLV